MLDISSKDKIVVIFSWIVNGVLEPILAILGPAWLEAVDILPCLRLSEGEVVGCYTDHCPILLVMG